VVVSAGATEGGVMQQISVFDPRHLISSIFLQLKPSHSIWTDREVRQLPENRS